MQVIVASYWPATHHANALCITCFPTKVVGKNVKKNIRPQNVIKALRGFAARGDSLFSCVTFFGLCVPSGVPRAPWLKANAHMETIIWPKYCKSLLSAEIFKIFAIKSTKNRKLKPNKKQLEIGIFGMVTATHQGCIRFIYKICSKEEEKIHLL